VPHSLARVGSESAELFFANRTDCLITQVGRYQCIYPPTHFAARSLRGLVWVNSLAGLFEYVVHDSHMRGLDNCPHGAREEVFVLHEGGEEQLARAPRDEQLCWHPDAGIGTEQHEIRRAVSHFPAKHRVTGPTAVELQTDHRPSR
jgi:hypothetical protein